MGYQLGIDLGTTYTAAAVCRTSDRRWVEPEVVTLGTRSTSIPSVLYVAPDGSVLVGEAAERRALTEPDRVVREFKRRIGDPTPIVVAGRRWAPEELSARLVRWVVDRVAEREGGPAARIAITHPASWGVHKKDLLAAALGAQSLSVTFLAEPQAAALHYATAERVGPGSTIAVYDLGGGTFDAAVVRKLDPKEAAAGAAGFGLLGRPQGMERLGGVDFDEVVFEHVREGMAGAFEDLDDTDPAVLSAVARIRRECTEAKEGLSSDTEASIPVLLPASRGSVRLHRSEFETLIRPQVAETVEALRKAVASAGLEPSQLTAVLLVGGSSRIPLVAQMVSEQLDRPVAVDADPKNAIAKGASLAISPKPTASWPGVAIAPVPAAAAAAPAKSPSGPSRPGPSHPSHSGPSHPSPPRPALGTPPQGSPPPRPGVLPTPAGAAGFNAPPARGQSHESANHLLASNSGPDMGSRRPSPPEPPTRQVASAGWEYDQEPEQRRRPIGLLIGVGGLLAVAAIVIAVVLWPTGGGNNGTLNTGNSTGLNGATETAAPPAPGDSAVVPPPAANNGNNNGNANNNGNNNGNPGNGTPPKNENPAGKPPVIVPTDPKPEPSTKPSSPPNNGGGATTQAPPPSNNGGTPPTVTPTGNTGGTPSGGASGGPSTGGTPGAEGSAPPVVPVGNGGTPPTAAVPVAPSAAPAAPAPAAGTPAVVTT